MKALFSFVLIFIGSCGDLRVETQFESSIKDPSSSGEGELELAQSPQSQSFSGSIVVFDPEASVNDVQTILESSTNARKAKSKIYDLQKNVIPKYRDQVNAIDLQVANLQNELGDAKRIVIGVQDWFDEIIHGSLEYQSLLKRKKDYCEAVFWEFGFDRQLLEPNISKVPIPSLFCAGQYQEMAKVCLNKTSNLVGCYWQRVIMETQLFKQAYDEEKRDIFAKWAASESFRLVFADASARLKFKKGFLKQKKILSSLARRLRSFGGLEAGVKEVKSLFVGDQNLISVSQLLHRARSENWLVEGVANLDLKAFLNQLSILSQSSEQQTLTDALINKVGSDIKEPLPADEITLYSAMFPFSGLSPSESKTLQQFQDRRQEILVKKEDVERRLAEYQGTFFDNVAHGVQVSQKEQVATALFNYTVGYGYRVFEGQMEFVFGLNLGERVIGFLDSDQEPRLDHVLFGCLDLSLKNQVPCKRGRMKNPVNLTFDRSLNLLTITTKIPEDLQVLGLEQKTKAQGENGGFNHLNPAMLRKSTIRLQIEHGQLNGYPFAGGQIAFIQPSGEIWQEGSLSLFR